MATRTAIGAGLFASCPARACLVGVVLIALACAPLTVAAQESEQEVKAQFVERFTRFVDWPESSGAGNPGTPFVVGVFGDEPLREALSRLAERVQIKGKRAEVVRLDGVEEATRCQLVFVSSRREAELDALLAVTRDRPILTVGDGGGFATRGVLINFYQEGKYLRFEINEPATRAAGLRIAADLLAVAKVVR